MALISTCVAFLFPCLVLAIPDGSTLDVTTVCGGSTDQPAQINLRTDLFIQAHAVCKDNVTKEFFSEEDTIYNIPVSYVDGGPNCVFQKRNSSEVYTVEVFIQWSTTPGSLPQQNVQRYKVTCVLQETANGNYTSEFKDIVEPLVAPRVIQSHEGDAASSSFSLRMTDILGDNLADPVDIGKYVKMIATSDGGTGELGLRPVNCDAVGIETNKRFAILRAGCGDGLVIDKKDGFITEGTTSVSPMFLTFRLFNDDQIRYECNFTLCTKNCDGSSCAVEVKKRSPDDDDRLTDNKKLTLSTQQLLIGKGKPHASGQFGPPEVADAPVDAPVQDLLITKTTVSASTNAPSTKAPSTNAPTTQPGVLTELLKDGPPDAEPKNSGGATGIRWEFVLLSLGLAFMLIALALYGRAAMVRHRKRQNVLGADDAKRLLSQ